MLRNNDENNDDDNSLIINNENKIKENDENKIKENKRDYKRNIIEFKMSYFTYIENNIENSNSLILYDQSQNNLKNKENKEKNSNSLILYDPNKNKNIKNKKEKEENEIFCKFCYMTNTQDLIAPCGCKGSIKYVHKKCLKLWRFRKNYKEIKNCEQCFLEYKLDEDFKINKIILHLLTISFLIILFLIFNFFFNLFCESFFFMIYDYDDSFFKENIMNNMNNNLFNKSINNIFKENMNNNLFKKNINNNIFICNLNYFHSSIILITFYQLIFSFSFFSSLNLIFTIFRIFIFDFLIDKILIFFIFSFYFKKLYFHVYCNVDRISYYIFNSFFYS